MSARASVTIDFFADFSCPWCYVGWAALKQAAVQTSERAACALTWRTFLLAPDMPAAGMERNATSKHGDEAQRAKTKAALLKAAEDAGAPLNLDASSIIPNTLNAHRLVHLASNYGLGEAAIDALYTAYFADGADIGAPRQLFAIAERLGLDPEETGNVLASADFSELMAMHQAAAKIGIGGVPVAIFNRKTPVLGAASVGEYKKAIEAAI